MQNTNLYSWHFVIYKQLKQARPRDKLQMGPVAIPKHYVDKEDF